MTELNQSIVNLQTPQRIARLPISPKGFYVPWFIAWIDGEPDFRTIGPDKINTAISKQLCWICGDKMGSYKCFVVGPMCTVNRVSSEPPSHLECAQYAAVACPFLNNPRMRRNEKDMPKDAKNPAGVMIKRNPGVTALWVTKSYKPFKAGKGVLLEIGNPTNVLWYSDGRPATRAEVDESIRTGLPILEAEAAKEGHKAVQMLKIANEKSKRYLPNE